MTLGVTMMGGVHDASAVVGVGLRGGCGLCLGADAHTCSDVYTSMKPSPGFITESAGLIISMILAAFVVSLFTDANSLILLGGVIIGVPGYFTACAMLRRRLAQPPGHVDADTATAATNTNGATHTMSTMQYLDTLRELEDELDLDRHRYQQQHDAAPPSSKLQQQLQRVIDGRRRQHDAVRQARTLLQNAASGKTTDRAAAEQLVAILQELDHEILIAWITMVLTNIMDGHTVRELLRGYQDAAREHQSNDR